MSKNEISILACVVAFGAVLPACGGGSASVRVSDDGVQADATATADVPGVSATATATTGTTYDTTTTTGGQYATTTTGTCIEEWVHMPVLINFPTGGVEMDMQSRAVLDELVRSAQTRTDLRAVRVEGHTDRCGGEANNMVLSQNRAEAVALELVRLGVPREQIMTIGFGSQQPRANESCDRAHELSRATNRRVEFSMLVCRGQ